MHAHPPIIPMHLRLPVAHGAAAAYTDQDEIAQPISTSKRLAMSSIVSRSRWDKVVIWYRLTMHVHQPINSTGATRPLSPEVR